MYNVDQESFVRDCYNWYRESDLEPGNPEDGIWHQCHYPVAKCLGGTERILLLKEHHAIQGTLQSLECNHCCVGGWEKKYLISYWAHLLPFFIRACSIRGKRNMDKIHSKKDEKGHSLFGLQAATRLNEERDKFGKSINAANGGRASRKNGKGALCRTSEQMSKDGKVGGTISKNMKLGIFAPGQQSAGGCKTSSQKWQCTITGKISAAGPLTGWQKARGVDVTNRIRRFDLEG